jgi:hypothetical protein
MTVEYLPKGSPGLSAVEECWRGQGKDDYLLVSKYYPRSAKLKTAAITNYYYRTKRLLEHPQIYDERIYELMLVGVAGVNTRFCCISRIILECCEYRLFGPISTTSVDHICSCATFVMVPEKLYLRLWILVLALK